MSGRRKPGSSCCGGSGINDKRRRSGFHLWVERGKTVQLARGHAFQVYVEEGAHAGAGSRKSATLLQGSEHTEPSKNRKENKFFVNIWSLKLKWFAPMIVTRQRFPSGSLL